ncbi:BGLU7 [Symbiodinium sp. KB8]|nr:BGLU7 [Symbiodinium sp. KB8]
MQPCWSKLPGSEHDAEFLCLTEMLIESCGSPQRVRWKAPLQSLVTGEALQLLQELKKRRQECSHVKHFNTLLHQAIEQRRKEQDIAGVRGWPKANISERLSREEAARMASKAVQVLRLWKLRAFRSQHLLADVFQHHLSTFLKRRVAEPVWRLRIEPDASKPWMLLVHRRSRFVHGQQHVALTAVAVGAVTVASASRKRWRLSCAAEPAEPAIKSSFLAFPKPFVFGVATSAYQIEGAANMHGRKPSIWDEFSHKPGTTNDGATGDVACDHYHLFKEDVALMSSLNVKAYRFSISWSRILPDGTGHINEEGIKFYSDLIDSLLSAGIDPWVTLYHWDLPATLDWLGPKEPITSAFSTYARTCFKHFGDRVKNWITLNEPWCSAVLGYNTGDHAPGYTDAGECAPYIAGHNMLLAHAEAVRVFREEFADQEGQIGISLNADWRQPMESTSEDRRAARRAMDFSLGWFAQPVFHGDYPECMKETCGDRLPTFTPHESALLKGSSDFFGLNSYSANFAKVAQQPLEGSGYWNDIGVEWWHTDPDWERSDMGWPIVPWSLREILLFIQERYSPLGGIIITENGCACESEESADLDCRSDALTPVAWAGDVGRHQADMTFDDPERVRFFRAHLSAVHAAISRGADVRGYFAWSFLDNFEWAEGYAKRFGIVRVDFPTQERMLKSSARFLANVFETSGLEAPCKEEQYAGKFYNQMLLRSWHLACFDNAAHVEVALLEKHKLMEGVQAKIDHARQQLKRDCLHSRTKGLSLLEGSARLHACRQVMSFWAAIAAVEVDRRSHMRLYVLFNRSNVEGFFHIWAELSKRRQQSTSSADGVEKISERTLLAVAAPRLRVMLLLWRMGADLEAANKETPQVTEAAATQARVGKALRSQLLLRTAAQHVRQIECSLVASSLRTWRRNITECDDVSLAWKHEQELCQLVHRRRLVAEQRSSAWQAAAQHQLLCRYFCSWATCLAAAAKQRRIDVEVARNGLKKQAAECVGRLHDLQTVTGSLAGATHLSSAIRRRMRIALSLFRKNLGCAEAESDVCEKLQAARESCASLVSHRRKMEDWFVQQHHSVVAARQAAQQVARAWAVYLTLKLFRSVVVSWRISTLKAALERERQWQDMQHKAKDTSDSVEKQRAAQSKVAEVMMKSLDEGSLRLIFLRWHRLAFKERRQKQILLFRQESEARLEVRRRQQSQAELTTARYREHAFASFTAAGSVGSPSWLRLFLWDWRRAVTSTTSKRILRLWRIIASMEIFKCKRWLLEFCVQVWAALTCGSALQAMNSEWLRKRQRIRKEEQLQETLWARLAAGHVQCLLHDAFSAWRRSHQADQVRDEVKLVCEQWNDEEQAARRHHQRITWQLSCLRSWAYRSMTTVQDFEDLRDAFLAWAQEIRFAKAEAPLELSSSEVQNGPEAQQRLESLVRDSWIERSLYANARQRRNCHIALVWFAWRAAAQETRVARKRERRKRRAHVIEQQRTSEWQKCTKRLVLDSWQMVLCTNRRLWLENRRRWLQSSLEVVRPESAQANEADLRALQSSLQSDFPSSLQKLTFGNPGSEALEDLLRS